jgi:uncharacterized protein (DUF983 family)
MIKTLLRCLSLRCPVCGESTIARRPFQIKDHCSYCGAVFKREDGFFVGAILANIVTTEAVILAVYGLFILSAAFDYHVLLLLLFAIAVMFPLAFYHHSWSVWLTLDHLVESLPTSTPAAKGRSGSANLR